MAKYQISRKTEPPIIVNRHCDPDQEINILLLGQTGVGKSTFINAFANYVVNDTLEQAVNDEMQVVISSSFSHTVHENFEQKNIIIGKEDKYEQNKTVGESSTLQCRSFVFPIGNRSLRFIDTPGIGDTKGINQDEKNFQEILDYIAQFEHLNAVFVMFKPNEERLTPLFKYSVYELLRHLNIHVKDNIVFIFTNVRSTFFMPGSTSSLLRTLLDGHYQKYQIEVPFSKENTFLFDNEAFRYLALCKNGIQLDNEQKLGYTKSWDHSVNEYRRLMEHIIKLPLHAISHVLSLNEAEQLVRKLPRPIAETARLIEVNIQLAKDHKQKVNKNPQIASQGIPQQAVEIESNRFRTVCMSDKCRRVTGAGIDRRVEYSSICHDTCYLTGLEQETLNECPKIRDCEKMNPRTGICGECRCLWDQHKHITYEVNIHQTHAKSSGATKESSLIDINKCISDLKEEQRQIQDIYKKLAQFLYANSLLPINDGYIEYLKYFIHEEKLKETGADHNSEVIGNLERMMTDYEHEIELFKRTVQEYKKADKQVETIPPDQVFTLAGQLYRLPINGKQIRDQVKGITAGQGRFISEREKLIELPAKAAKSRVMLQLRNIITSS